MATVTSYNLDRLKNDLAAQVVERIAVEILDHAEPIIDAIKEGIVDNVAEDAENGIPKPYLGGDADRRVKTRDGELISDAMYQDVDVRTFPLPNGHRIAIGNSESFAGVAQGQDLGWGLGGSGKRPGGARFATVYGAHWMDSAAPDAKACVEKVLASIRSEHG